MLAQAKKRENPSYLRGVVATRKGQTSAKQIGQMGVETRKGQGASSRRETCLAAEDGEHVAELVARVLLSAECRAHTALTGVQQVLITKSSG